MATAASRADRASVAILNGFGRAVGDAVIGLQALHVAIRLGAVPPRPALFRLPGLSPMVEAVHAAADFAEIRTLPWEFAAPATRFAAGRFERVVDLRDFAFDPDFRRSSMIDFFLQRLGVEPRLVPPSSRRNRWLAQYAQPEPPALPGGYVLICPKASTALRDMPAILHERILAWTLRMAPVVTQGEVPDGLRGRAIQVPPCTSFAALCGLVRHARWVISTDTAMVHLADAFEVPCLAFFPTHRPEWRVRDYPRCMSVALRTALPLGVEFVRGPEDEALARAAWFPDGEDFAWLDRALAISAIHV